MKIDWPWARQVPHTSKIVPGRPEAKPDRSGLALIAIMKNEARHIADWIKFHRLAGVTDFYLYDDGSTDGTPDLASRAMGVHVTVIPWQLTARLEDPRVRFSRQVLAYCHAIENFGGAYRWMGFIDIDEYIVPKSTDTILQVLDGLKDYANISLPWTMFGPNGHETPPHDPAPFAYTSRAADRVGPLLNFKCILDPCEVIEARVHRFRTTSMGRMSANDLGKTAHYKRRSSPNFLSDTALQLNHYYTRSRRELAEKLNKGAVSDSPLDRRNNKVMEKLDIIEATSVEDISAIEFLKRRNVGDAKSFRECSPRIEGRMSAHEEMDP